MGGDVLVVKVERRGIFRSKRMNLKMYCRFGNG